MARQSPTNTQECRNHLERLFRCAGSLTPAATACRLLDACGSLPAVLAASSARRRFLTGKDHVADDVLDAFASGFLHALRYQVVKGPILANWIGLLDYLKADMAYHRHERIRVLYLNTRNVLIGDEIISEGTIDSAPFDVREILRRALEVGSASIILVHNHPSGNPEPSADDIRVTRNLVAASKMLGISVHDHLVIGTDGHVSMRSHGLM